MALDLYGAAPVNNAGIDPMQGFDFECWAQDSQSGAVAFFGRFQSLTLSVRDATETYLELGQRIPIYLNGEIQIAWVLEQGLVDMAFVHRTFGVRNIRRDQLVTRGPRFHIAFDANAADRLNDVSEDASPTNTGAGGSDGTNTNANTGLLSSTNRLGAGNARTSTNLFSNSKGKPTNQGRYELMRCKVDSVSLGIMPGRRVAAVRWEGVSEGISFVNQTIQTFKANTNDNGNNEGNDAANAGQAAAGQSGSASTSPD